MPVSNLTLLTLSGRLLHVATAAFGGFLPILY
ncbi:hypothetical protein SAMN04490186_1468 [Pseudomonas grimontii]|jgi:hypothetical protein|uniref:Uncharacterized protein n=1 Tax=Pseudomonas grimontii TaxID=129847 RepID=A0ABY0TDX4_9PSED|nr:hypothetical protein SAMN04490186_1468 [Pseudomonas grimontii]